MRSDDPLRRNPILHARWEYFAISPVTQSSCFSPNFERRKKKKRRRKLLLFIHRENESRPITSKKLRRQSPSWRADLVGVEISYEAAVARLADSWDDIPGREHCRPRQKASFGDVRSEDLASRDEGRSLVSCYTSPRIHERVESIASRRGSMNLMDGAKKWMGLAKLRGSGFAFAYVRRKYTAVLVSRTGNRRISGRSEDFDYTFVVSFLFR